MDAEVHNPKFSELAIETALTLRLAFHLPLRQAEGFLRSLFRLMDVALDVPDHTTLSRRSAKLEVSVARQAKSGAIDLIIDSSGLATVGEGEWSAAKHGGNGRRGWKKLHPGVDANGEILAQVLTDSNVDDGTKALRSLRTLVMPFARSLPMPRTARGQSMMPPKARERRSSFHDRRPRVRC